MKLQLHSEQPTHHSSELRSHVADVAKVNLLRLGCTEPLGIPVWFLQHLTTCDESPVAPHILLGLAREEDRHLGCDLVEEYFDCVGYRFSWGWIEERHHEETSDYGPSWRFEVFVDALLRKFPRADVLETIFGKMFDVHPRRRRKFNRSTYASGTFTVLEFEACSADEWEELRTWMASTFVPRILPDLLATAGWLVELSGTDRVRFNDEVEAWCGGKRRMSHLVRAQKEWGGRTTRDRVPRAWATAIDCWRLMKMDALARVCKGETFGGESLATPVTNQDGAEGEILNGD